MLYIFVDIKIDSLHFVETVKANLDLKERISLGRSSALLQWLMFSYTLLNCKSRWDLPANLIVSSTINYLICQFFFRSICGIGFIYWRSELPNSTHAISSTYISRSMLKGTVSWDRFQKFWPNRTRLVFEFFRGFIDFIVQKVHLLRLMPVCVGLIVVCCLFLLVP